MEDLQQELSQRLNKNGWRWSTISSLVPGIIRILLTNDEGKSVRRKCVEAPTLQEAIQEAEKFVNSINTKENIMLEYDIIVRESIGELKQEVNRWLQDGWKPQGGMYKERGVIPYFSEKRNKVSLYYQPVVREVNNANTKS